ncbi:hypothetical protein MMPV_007114 [Pyropia vietnamensis]
MAVVRQFAAATVALRRAVKCIPRRHAMVALVGSCSVLNYADRVNLSVAVIPMAAAFRWDAAAQGVVLSAFFWGYAPAQLMGAAACRRWGAVWVLAAAASAWSLFTAATPAAAGAGGWVLPHERGRAVALLLLGVHVGTTVALLGSPRLLAVAGWPSIFYVFGGAGLLWVAMWVSFARDAPPWGGGCAKTEPDDGDGRGGQWAPLPTTDDGLATLGSAAPAEVADPSNVVAGGGAPSPGSVVLTLGTSGRGGGSGGILSLGAASSVTDAFGNADLATTIRAVFSHHSTVALVVVQFAHSWCHYVVLSWLPTFFSAAYGVPAEELGFTFLPYAAMAVTTSLGGTAADALLRRGTPLLAVRRRLHLVATLGPAVALLVATRATTPFAAVAAITVACAAAAGGATGGFEAAFLDVASPGAVGTLKAVANTAASGAGMMAVPLTGAMRGVWGWGAVFGSLVPVQLASAAVFWRWGGVDRVTL